MKPKSFGQIREAIWTLLAILAVENPAFLASLTGLADLAKPAVFKLLRQAMSRGRSATSYEARALRKLEQVAREVLGYTAPELEALTAERKGLKTNEHQMAERFLRALQPFLRKRTRIADMMRLPRRWIEEAETRPPTYALSDHQQALALTMASDVFLGPADIYAMRRENLLIPDVGPIGFEIPEPAIASEPLAGEFSPDASAIIRQYLAFLECHLRDGSEIDWLFVTLEGRRLVNTQSARIAARIKEAIGYRLSLDQAQALMIAVYIHGNPTDRETPRRALGLRDGEALSERYSAIVTMAAASIAVSHAEKQISRKILFGPAGMEASQ